MDGGWLRRKAPRGAETAPESREPRDETAGPSESDGESEASPRSQRRRNRVSLMPSDASSSDDENDSSDDLDRILHEDDSAEDEDADGEQLRDELGLDDGDQWDRLAQRHPGLFMFQHVPLPRRGTEIAMHMAGGGGGGGGVVDLENTQDEAREIDLTTLSSDSEGETTRHGHSAEDDEDEVEIVGSTAPLAPVPIQRAGAQVSSRGSPSRKRRRRNGDVSPANLNRPFNTQSAESTNISLENNETIERFKSSLKCSVCLEVIQDMTSTICGHVYCAKCIRLAISVTHKCPLCQRPLRPTDIHGLFF